jgi:hypothetical protein
MKPIPTSTNSPDDETFEKKVEIFLRSTGRLFPLTDEQVKLFEKHEKPAEVRFLCSSAEAILERGFIKLQQPISKTTPPAMQDDFMRAAARNGGVIPQEVRRKMDEDRGMSKDDSKE